MWFNLNTFNTYPGKKAYQQDIHIKLGGKDIILSL